MGLILAAVLLCQAPASRADLELSAAVEDFARAAPPAPWRRMIDGLGAAGYRDREAASLALESAVRSDRGSARWLFAGRRHRDPEVRLRCNAILRRLHPCPACGGDGMHGAPGWAYECGECGGAGTAWPHSPWD